jgi:hypothetical protein
MSQDLKHALADLVNGEGALPFRQLRQSARNFTGTELEKVICPLQSGPKSMLFWTRKGMKNAIQKTHAGGDYRQAA